MTQDTPENLHWRRKINALFHDTPDKATDILTHEHRAALLRQVFQFKEEEYFREQADWAAAAADRLPFPPPGKLLQDLQGITEFPHPLGGAALPNEPFKSSDEALETVHGNRPFLVNSNDPRAIFICIWRFWRNWVTSRDSRFARIPADTRIPDHTIWNHLNVTTAFQGALPLKKDDDKEEMANKLGYTAADAPRLLLFSVGPVQDFIAAARSTRDLWSGSYLLSYLVSCALGKIALDLGPDHLIFPNLLDQPLIDLQLKETIFAKVSLQEDNEQSENQVWTKLGYGDSKRNLSRLLTPSLPNRFMALLPAKHPVTGASPDEYARSLTKTIQDELRKIAKSIQDFLGEHNDKGLLKLDGNRFGAQVDQMLETQWQVLSIPVTIEELYETADKLLPKDDAEGNYTPRTAVKAILEMAKIETCKPQYSIRPETGWGLLNALIAFLHDGAKSNRAFDAWRTGQWTSDGSHNKDALTGKEEVVLQVPTDSRTGEEGKTTPIIESYCTDILKLSKSTFKPGELLGAATLIKRLWHHTYLPQKIGMSADELKNGHPMPNTHAIAKGYPYDNSDDSDKDAERDHSDKYFAILALDGDEMGKWISGSKTPKMSELLSPEAKAFYGKEASSFLDVPRAVTPSWHLQFAEALGNFSFYAAERIVEAFDGRLIYAGGDDVLAMLPAKDALPCARALRAAFRGEKGLNELAKGVMKGESRNRRSDRTPPLFNIEHEGFLKLHEDSGAAYGTEAGLLDDPVKFPVIVPGPRSDVSVGIAIAHFKAPLQDVVRAAQAAEKRAKRSIEKGGLGRGAVAITIYKRSGEILQWGARWATQDPDKHPASKETAGYRLFHMLSDALIEGQLNSRFPHKLETLLTPYLSQAIESDPCFIKNFSRILEIELDHCLSRNEGGKLTEKQRQLFIEYWEEMIALENKATEKQKEDKERSESERTSWISDTEDPEHQDQDGAFNHHLTQLINLLRTAAWSVRGVSKP